MPTAMPLQKYFNIVITLILTTPSTPSACKKKENVGGRCPEPLAKDVSLAILYFFIIYLTLPLYRFLGSCQIAIPLFY